VIALKSDKLALIEPFTQYGRVIFNVNVTQVSSSGLTLFFSLTLDSKKHDISYKKNNKMNHS
jgi:hypothetical protein